MPVAMAKRALNDDPHCGDECAYWQNGGRTTLCMVDGLGHGERAETAARAAVDYVAHHLWEPLADVFAGCDSAIRHTVGVVMGIAVIDEGAGTLTYAGIGNTRATVVADVAENATGLSSYPGIVGGGYRTLSPEVAPLMPDALVLMYTDGIRERVDLSRYDGGFRADLQRLAEKIIEDWRRGTDDVAVLLYRGK